MHFSTSTMQTLLFFLFMAHRILANDFGSTQPLSQGGNLPSPEFFVPNDFLAETPEHLSVEDPDWSRLAGNWDPNCNSGSQNPVDQYFPQGRFRRSSSRFFKRQDNHRCPSPESQNLQRGTRKEPPARQPGNVVKPTGPPTGERMRNMSADDQLMLILTQPHSEGKPNPEKCNHNLSYQVPICAPSNKMRTSPQHVIVPSRFWVEADPCTEDLETFWCCTSALQLNLGSLRYPAAGFQCESVPDP